MDILIIQEWLRVGYSSGYGRGSGYGYGNGDGYGYGDGDGYGYGEGYGSGRGSGYASGRGDGSGRGYASGYGDGDGDGDGSGCGDGVSFFCEMPVFYVDGISTIIKSILGNMAKGFILQDDFTLKPCYITKNESYFAHGETIKSAVEELRNKIFENLDTDETIERFISEFKTVKKIKGSVLFEWHHYLTGSCLIGRNDFVQRKGLNLENEFTVDEFISLCENDFGSSIIKQLKDRWISEKSEEIKKITE